MNLLRVCRQAGLMAAGMILAAGSSLAGEKTMMHCFAFTEIKSATPEEWSAWKKATDAMPQKMSGIIHRVWHGKLRGPLNQFRTNGETQKKLAAGETGVTGPIERLQRTYGVCFEMKAGAATLKEYTANPYHKEWSALYEKVRVAGTTTYDIMGE
ncbi:MAG: hypothetical protein FJW39_11515 [Acidobacteria bacterium]|nr:hypothetical protein [Acidobacteriota bacterium]